MPQFYPLTVTDIDRSSSDAVVLTLEPDSTHAADFDYAHGQYLTLRQAIDGEELRRSYSICSSVNDKNLRVGIKKVAGGGFSTWANELLKVGDQIDAMVPTGKFTFPLDPSAARSYLGIAAGSGITPILSIVKTILETESESNVTLFFGNRSVATIMFREEIEDLKNTYMTRFSVLHILSSGSDISLTSGRLDKEKQSILFGDLIDVPNLDRAFICGPQDMTMIARDELVTAGMQADKVHFELFGAPQSGRLKKRAKVDPANSRKSVCNAQVIVDGVRHAVEINGAEMSVLDAALEANIGAPYSCKAGVCSTCRARVVEGSYDFVTNYALEDYEVEQGFVLSCQCFPTGDKLVIDFDH